MDHVTAVLDEPVTVGVNCCCWPPLRLAVAGVIVMPTPEPEVDTIWMALILGRSAVPVMNWMVILPADGVAVNVLSRALKAPPAWEKMSKLESTVVPLIVTLKMR